MNKNKKAPKFQFTPVPEKVPKKVVQQRVNVNRLYRGRWTVQEPAPVTVKNLKKNKKKVFSINRNSIPFSLAPTERSRESQPSVLECESNVGTFDFRAQSKPEPRPSAP